MHIPDGFLDPKISIGMLGAAVAVLAYSMAKVKESVTALAPQEAFAAVGKGVKNLAGQSRRILTKFGEQKIYKMGMVAALVFAAQMFNFPIAYGTSGHLIGGVLAVVLLGPFAGVLVIAAVLVVQALFFADGGLLVMGANIINMAFFGALLPYYIYAGLKRFIPEWLSIGAAAWCSVVMAALAASFEIGLSGTFALGAVLSSMLKVHIVIGIAEAAITVALVYMFRKLFGAKEKV
ncbi:MAG: energy-coupling factor ABC transporter permease [Candidatus Saganbacteria bacterium]|nr:energy-coupling factor ABC transporter permease [Candidatus Saganbacteria bacterium]